MLDAQTIFTDVINKMTSTLDSVGLYVVDCHMEIMSPTQYHSLEELRKDVINNKANVLLDVDCFIGKGLWRTAEDYQPYLTELSIQMQDILQYFKDDFDQDENES